MAAAGRGGHAKTGTGARGSGGCHAQTPCRAAGTLSAAGLSVMSVLLEAPMPTGASGSRGQPGLMSIPGGRRPGCARPVCPLKHERGGPVRRRAIGFCHRSGGNLSTMWNRSQSSRACAGVCTGPDGMAPACAGRLFRNTVAGPPRPRASESEAPPAETLAPAAAPPTRERDVGRPAGTSGACGRAVHARNRVDKPSISPPEPTSGLSMHAKKSTDRYRRPDPRLPGCPCVQRVGRLPVAGLPRGPSGQSGRSPSAGGAERLRVEIRAALPAEFTGTLAGGGRRSTEATR